MFKRAIVYIFLLSVLLLMRANAADWMAFEIRCDQQYTSAELPDLIWSQGSTPLIAARTYERGKAVPPRDDVTVQMMIAPSATSRYWAVVTNQATNATSYLLQWPTIGTNTTAAAPWYYVVYFLRDGHRYWTGSGALWIEETTATGDGLVWQEITSIDLAALTNDIKRIDDFILDMDNLRGELQGPAWLTPARFEWEANIVTTVTTNTSEEEDGGWAVLTRDRTVVTEKEYILDPAIERNQWDETLETSVDGPATLDSIGNGTYLLSWIDGTPTGTPATVSGQLGDWRDSKTVTLTQTGNVLTQHWFSSFAPGGVREQLADVLTTWTNIGGNIYRFSNYSVGKTSTVETLSLRPHPDFWARDTDLSGVSVWNDTGGYYYTQPATLIASNLCYGAAHWSIAIGKTLAWYGKDGKIHSAKIVDQRRMTGDLCVSKISPALDTNAVTAYPILDLFAILQKIQAGAGGGSDGGVYGLPPMPVLAMSQAQRGWIMRDNLEGGAYGIWDADAGAYIRNSRSCAVGGDSGHPVFVSTDATNLVLIGSYWTPTGLSVPGAQVNIPLIRSAVEAMGADPDAIRWETWADWPTYLGPLNP